LKITWPSKIFIVCVCPLFMNVCLVPFFTYLSMEQRNFWLLLEFGGHDYNTNMALIQARYRCCNFSV